MGTVNRNLITQSTAFAEYVRAILGNLCEKVVIDGENDLVVWTSPGKIQPVLRVLKDHTNFQFKVLLDITATDYPSREKRFEVVYILQSVRYNSRLVVKTNVDAFEGLSTAVDVYPSACWAEREIWDLFGILFHDHPDLRRILTDYGFEGHPMRKDFPLTGFVEVRYDSEKKSVVAEPLELSQEFRNFDFQSPWSTNHERKISLNSV